MTNPSDVAWVFNWPVFGAREEEAVLEVMRRPDFADEIVVPCFEKEFAAWCGTDYAIAQNCGTSAILTAMFAVGVGHGDEVIVPSATYWATALPAFSLGATVVFADIDPHTLSLCPADVSRKISPKTKAIVVVHIFGYPADMDGINRVAKAHGVRVIEDASHAHGSLYKGQKTGSLADVAAFSLCGKPMHVGEGGMITTSDNTIRERCLAWAHNFRFNHLEVNDPELLRFAGLPLGGVTTRMHNLSAAIGRAQLQSFDERIAEVDSAMNLFWDLLEGYPGLAAHRPPKTSGSTMGGWYAPHGLYHSKELGGLSAAGFAHALRAEGFQALTRSCLTEPLHRHPILQDCDVYGHGRPTRVANATRDVRELDHQLLITDSIRTVTVPPFKRYHAPTIRIFADCFKKVLDQHMSLIESDPGDCSAIPDVRGDA
ncbi:DegT/DnrJ/EryC1/StrS family aminotransferase [Pseudomonas chlororaphis]|uniref:DegT/DnrJ/EryC1/StrS family aminotransferase n=1 Tax=Pseudomonas chlororaphis TaxID=587753 RepID=UPI0013DD963E|nr:DegT/DnrJ/EryC1/StrS family aminotransferase [Pseudomonas chlororaphis]